MSYVFISYARESESEARKVEQALRGAGYGVWRDSLLPAHRSYAEVIEEQVKSAKAVLVLWSNEARKSHWVRAEADAARELGTLIQASLDGVAPPMPFNQIQSADLSEWVGDADHPGWEKLRGSVAELLGKPVAEEQAPAPQRRKTSVCVLPFANMSGDAEQEYFSDGISEDITTDLSKVSALEVVARNTAFQFKGKSVDICELAARLGVSHVLEGSVRKVGQRVRITAQLIDGRGGGHIWAERYDRDLTDIFAIQDELSKAIVAALKVRLLPAEKNAIEQRGTNNADAYNLYLMARQHWLCAGHGDPDREETVIRLCRRIVDVEPGYGRAWALMALAQSSLRSGYNRGDEDGVRAAERALELDPSLAEAHSAKARAFAAKRMFSEAEKQVQLALDLAPDSWEANCEAAAIYYWGQKFLEATHYFERCVKLVPDDRHSLDMLLCTYRTLGDDAGAWNAAERLLRSAQAALANDPCDSDALAKGANAFITLGDLEQAREWIDRAILIEPDNLGLRYNFVCTLINYSDELELAFEHLDFVFERSVGSLVRRADIDSDLDPIRDHPHFRAIYAAARERLARLDAEEQGPLSVAPPLA